MIKNLCKILQERHIRFFKDLLRFLKDLSSFKILSFQDLSRSLFDIFLLKLHHIWLEMFIEKEKKIHFMALHTVFKINITSKHFLENINESK